MGGSPDFTGGSWGRSCWLTGAALFGPKWKQLELRIEIMQHDPTTQTCSYKYQRCTMMYHDVPKSSKSELQVLMSWNRYFDVSRILLLLLFMSRGCHQTQKSTMEPQSAHCTGVHIGGHLWVGYFSESQNFWNGCLCPTHGPKDFLGTTSTFIRQSYAAFRDLVLKPSQWPWKPSHLKVQPWVALKPWAIMGRSLLVNHGNH
jgi:hypothetical protein